ncbi:hypothetical protein GGE06_008106 [Streptomyces sp. SFB5A]|uniref:Uncharacterized protein n=1 Tax=Streptomyces nymphaeiformis TaxID=2663842 RepID=A0A7W7U8Z3_9ACTN|nr:hypothetical protein [Streptomyces nymphaeiformis]
MLQGIALPAIRTRPRFDPRHRKVSGNAIAAAYSLAWSIRKPQSSTRRAGWTRPCGSRRRTPGGGFGDGTVLAAAAAQLGDERRRHDDTGGLPGRHGPGRLIGQAGVVVPGASGGDEETGLVPAGTGTHRPVRAERLLPCPLLRPAPGRCRTSPGRTVCAPSSSPQATGRGRRSGRPRSTSRRCRRRHRSGASPRRRGAGSSTRTAVVLPGGVAVLPRLPDVDRPAARGDVHRSMSGQRVPFWWNRQNQRSLHWSVAGPGCPANAAFRNTS